MWITNSSSFYLYWRIPLYNILSTKGDKRTDYFLNLSTTFIEYWDLVKI